MQQITRISPCVFTKYDKHNNPVYDYKEEIIIGADALRYRNGEAANSCAMGIETLSKVEGQVVVGKYNAYNSSALFMIGNGTDSTRKNIVEVYDSKVIISGALDVQGHTNFNSSIDVTNAATFSGSVSANDTLTVSGLSTFSNIKVNTLATIQDLQILNHIKNADNEYYITTSYGYSKSETNNLLGQQNREIQQKIDANCNTLNTKINNVRSELLEMINDVYKVLQNDINDAFSDTQYQLNVLQERTILLGAHPKKTYNFSSITGSLEGVIKPLL